jgi:hypothetical protein
VTTQASRSDGPRRGAGLATGRSIPTRLTLADLTDNDRQRIRTAFHEAGHAVAATVLGGRIFRAEVCDGRTFGVLGKTVHDHVPEGWWPSIVYAGPWAEARWLAGRRPTQRDMFGVLATTGRLDDKALSASGGFTEGARVVPLLERCWPSVIAVAQKLVRDNEVRNEDVYDALHLTDGGGPGSFGWR